MTTTTPTVTLSRSAQKADRIQRAREAFAAQLNSKHFRDVLGRVPSTEEKAAAKKASESFFRASPGITSIAPAILTACRDIDRAGYNERFREAALAGLGIAIESISLVNASRTAAMSIEASRQQAAAEV